MAKEKPIQSANTNLSATTESALNLLSHSMHSHDADTHDRLNHETRTALEEHQHTHALHRPTLIIRLKSKKKTSLCL